MDGFNGSGEIPMLRGTIILSMAMVLAMPFSTMGEWNIPQVDGSFTEDNRMTALSELTESDWSDIVRAEVDEEPPLLYILSPNDGSVIGNEIVTMEWMGVDNKSGIDRYEVKMDLVDWVPVGTSETYSYFNLEEGNHIFKVKAVDGAGRETIEQITFMIDRQSPSITILDPRDEGFYNTSQFTARWTATDDRSGIESYDYSLDGEAFINVGTVRSVVLSNLSQGMHRIQVTAYDMGGNSNMTEATFTVDTMAPSINIIEPEYGSYRSVRDVELVWDGSDAGTGITEYLVRMDDQNWVSNGLRTSRRFYQLEDGNHRLMISTSDRAGNQGQNFVDLTVDASPPDLTITYPNQGGYISQSPVNIQWEVSDRITDVVSVEVMDNRTPWKNVTGSRYPFTVTEEGTYTVSIRATDTLGNSVDRSVTFTVDRSPPDVLEFGPLGNDMPLDTSVFVSFSERMEKDSITFYVEGAEGEIIWRGERAAFSPAGGEFDPGIWYNVTVTANDLAGNPIEPISWSFNTTDMGIIRGRIVDEDGDPLPGVSIAIDDSFAESRPDGSFLVEVTGGTHRMVLGKDGYDTTEIEVNVTAGRTIEVPDIGLSEKDRKEVDLLALLMIPSAILLMVILVFIFSTILSRRMETDFEE